MAILDRAIGMGGDMIFGMRYAVPLLRRGCSVKANDLLRILWAIEMHSFTVRGAGEAIKAQSYARWLILIFIILAIIALWV
jgi:hypothetical protein